MLTTPAPRPTDARPGTSAALVPTVAPEPRPRTPATAPLRVVTDRDLRALRTRVRARRLVAACAFLVATGLFGVVIAHVLLMQGQFELQHLQERSADSQARYDRLRLQVSELESPDRIVAAAHEKLGMVTPPKITYLAPSADAAALPATRPSTHSESNGASAALPDRWSSVKSQLADG